MTQLLDQNGRRKYLDAKERRAFLEAAEAALPELAALCLVLYFTGCRISEALALTGEGVDSSANTITFRSLKKRKKGNVFRVLPVPESLIARLKLLAECKGQNRIWGWHRTTAARHIKKVMRRAGVVGGHACPKGLRHAFGVACVQNGIPTSLLKRWLGHTNVANTLIYSDLVGEDEVAMARRLW